jgi:hypothetical protein
MIDAAALFVAPEPGSQQVLAVGGDNIAGWSVRVLTTRTTARKLRAQSCAAFATVFTRL